MLTKDGSRVQWAVADAATYLGEVRVPSITCRTDSLPKHASNHIVVPYSYSTLVPYSLHCNPIRNTTL